MNVRVESLGFKGLASFPPQIGRVVASVHICKLLRGDQVDDTSFIRVHVCMHVCMYFCFNMSPRGDQVDQAWKVPLIDRYARTCQSRLHILSTYRPFDPLDAQALEHPPQSCFCLGFTAPTFPPPDLYCSSSSSTAFMMLSTIDASRRIDRPPGRMTIPVNSILCSSRLA